MIFFKNRSFRVKIVQVLSSRFYQVTGVPQGGVLSVTLFALKIGQITGQIALDDRLLTSLYVDDLQISYRHPDLDTIQQMLQQTLKAVQNWAIQNGS